MSSDGARGGASRTGIHGDTGRSAPRRTFSGIRSSSKSKSGSTEPRSPRSGRRARATSISEKSISARNTAAPSAGKRATVSPKRIDQRRRSGHTFTAFETGETRVDHEHPMFDGVRLQDVAPVRDAFEFAAGGEAAARRRARHDEHARALDGSERRHDRMPRVLADQHRHSAETRVERGEMPAAREEAFLVEHAVRRQEHLAVHVHDAMRRFRDLEVQRRVIERAAGVLEKADDDVDRRAREAPGAARHSAAIRAASTAVSNASS